MTLINFVSVAFASLLPLAMSVGCQSRLTEEEYVKWVTDYDNRLHARKVLSGFTFDIQYQPQELLDIQRRRAAVSTIDSHTDDDQSHQLQYFTLRIGTEDGTDITYSNVRDIFERQEREYYFSYRFQNDITLQENRRVFPCLLYHSEGSRGTDGARTFLLAFESASKESPEATIVIRSDIFDSLPIKIEVSKASIPIVQL